MDDNLPHPQAGITTGSDPATDPDTADGIPPASAAPSSAVPGQPGPESMPRPPDAPSPSGDPGQTNTGPQIDAPSKGA